MENVRESAESESPDGSLTGIREAVSDFEAGESPAVEDCVREALDALTLRRSARDQGGRFTPGNTAAATTFARSSALQAAVGSAKAVIVGRVTADLAAQDGAPETLQRLISGYAEATLTRESLFIQMVNDGGPITSKRRTSAVYGAYLSAIDREIKLAQILGLKREAKSADLARHLSQERA